jgi:hypothetical protein
MNGLTHRAAQRQHDNACDCCGDTHGAALEMLAADFTDGEVTNLLAEAGIDDTILEAAVYAVRHNDPLYLVRTYERLAGPVIQKAARDEAERLGDPT